MLCRARDRGGPRPHQPHARGFPTRSARAPLRKALTRVARRFQRLIRTFAEALYFNQLAEVIGQEQDTNDDERRVLGLFMLACWHGDQPLTPGEIVQHRARATERKRREREYMSPDDNAKHLCNFTAIARGMSVALQKQFTADEFKAVVKEFDSKAGKHKGVCGLNKDKLEELLESKGITLERFTAAMFTNVLTPDRFDVLEADLAETRRRVKKKLEGDEDEPVEPAPKPKPKPKPKPEPKPEPPVPHPPVLPGTFSSSVLAPGPLGPARSYELVSDTPAHVEAVNIMRSQPEIYVQAAHEELALMLEPPGQADEALAAAGSLQLSAGLAATPSWEALAAAPSFGGLVAAPSLGLSAMPSLGLSAAPSLGATPSLWPLPSTLALQGMFLAHSDPDPGKALQSQSAAELAPMAKARYQGLGPTLSADGGSWIPPNSSGANQDQGLCTASSLFATVALARASSLSRSSSSGGTQAPLLPEGAPRCTALRCVASLTHSLPTGNAASLLRVEEMVDLMHQPHFDEDVASAYLADSGVNLETLERAWNAPPGALTDEEFVDMLGLFRTVSIGKPKLQ